MAPLKPEEPFALTREIVPDESVIVPDEVDESHSMTKTPPPELIDEFTVTAAPKEPPQSNRDTSSTTIDPVTAPPTPPYSRERTLEFNPASDPTPIVPNLRRCRISLNKTACTKNNVERACAWAAAESDPTDIDRG
jgi:hypothetical protein